MTIRRLRTDDAAAFQALRLAALLDTPEAFASSHEEERHLTLEAVAGRIEDPRDPGVLGAFVDGQLVGVVGLSRERFAKMAHKGYIWGMYVAPAARGLGVARQLMVARDHRLLIEYESLGSDAVLSVPTPEHYVPLLYVLGASDAADIIAFPVEGIDGGSVSMLTVQFGEAVA